MAQSQMKRYGSNKSSQYPNGIFAEFILKVYNQYGERNYYNSALNYAKATINSSTGKIAFSYGFSVFTLANINPGMFLIQIYAPSARVTFTGIFFPFRRISRSTILSIKRSFRLR